MRRSASAAQALVLTVLLATLGCEGTREKLDPVFLDRQESRELAVQAMEAEHPDDRRRAINRLARSQYLAEDEIVRTMGLIARSDHSTSVRVAAVAALGQSRTPEGCAICAVLLPGGDMPMEQFPPQEVRAALLVTLRDCASAGLLDQKRSDHAADVAIWLLQSDISRQVRTSAAQLLGYLPRMDSVQALIQALEQRDFGVCNAAEQSLQRLTGRTFNHDPQAWRDFIASTDDPFVHPAEPAEQPGGIASWFGWLSADK